MLQVFDNIFIWQTPTGTGNTSRRLNMPVPKHDRNTMNISDYATKYQAALRKVSVNLPVETVEELLKLVWELRHSGKVRCTPDGKYSVLDFIENIASKGGSRKVWERLQEAHPETVTFCHGLKFPRSNGRAGNTESPATTELGILIIAYILPGDFGDRLRKASASLVLEAVSSYQIGNLEKLLDLEVEEQAPAFPYSITQLHQWSEYWDISYTRRVIKEDYELGAEYIIIEKQIYVTANTALIFLAVARPQYGVEVPEELRTRLFPWDKFLAFQDRKINRRRCQSKKQPLVNPDQLNIPFA